MLMTLLEAEAVVKACHKSSASSVTTLGVVSLID